jgi:hypothetical protein
MIESALTCANHPNRETTLRCNRCEKPICSKCALLTPVGYRCKECVRGQQKTFDNSISIDYPITFGVAFILSGVAVALLSFLGFWGLFLAPVVGGFIAEAIRWAIRRRRSRRIPVVAAAGAALGITLYVLTFRLSPFLAYMALGVRFDLAFAGSALLALLWPVIHGALLTGTMYYRLKGIRF